MKKKILSVLLCLCMVMALLPTTALAAGEGAGSTSISNFKELKDAFRDGGEYTLAANITVTEGLTLASDKTLTIHGNKKTIQPEVTGLNEQGIVNTGASAIDNIIDNSGTLTLDNLTIYGGKGRCINNSRTLTMTGVSLERAHLTGAVNFGAGLYNDMYAKALLTNCNIRRNGCESSGGGFYNYIGTLILENCAIVENRNFGGTNGGGAGENKGSSNAKLYMNNCTVANNQSSEIGGGLNNYSGTAYIMNSTFTGNVTTASEAHAGGGIGNNSGTVYAVNSVFAFNYANGAASDIGLFSGDNVHLYNCAYGAIVTSSGTTEDTVRDTCKKLTGTVSALFNGARTSGIVDKNGEEQSTTFDRPVITSVGSTYGVYPAESSALRSGGTTTYYDRAGFTVKMSYDNSNSTKTDLVGTATTVVTGPESSARAGLIGAIPANFAITSMYTVKVNPAIGGTVTGGSAQGNSYPEGTNTISITAVPGTGYAFSGWKVAPSDEIGSTANPYTLPSLTADVTLTPVFAPANTYTVTYWPGTNGTGDKKTDTKTEDVNLILRGETFTRTGYTQTGWAISDGGDKAYELGGTYSANAVASLYPVWTANTYTVTWKSQDGNSILETDLGVASGTDPSFGGAAPTKAQDDQYTYTFDGWATSENQESGTAVGDLPVVTGNVIYYAAFSKTPRNYTVTLNTNGGAIADGKNVTSYTYGTPVTLPGVADMTKAGYTFGGWYDNSGFTGDAVTAIAANATGAKTFYANWTANTYGISLSQTETHTFTGATAGYGEQTALDVTVTNTGSAATGALTVALTAGNTDAFEVSTSSISSITTTNDTDTFTVKPNTGLGAGTYTATVTVSGQNIVSKSFNVSFTVTKADQSAPAAPTMASKTSSSVTLNAITTTGHGAVQYAMNTTNSAPTSGWKTETTFTGLNAETTYYFFARYAGDENYKPAVSGPSEIETAAVETVPVPPSGGGGGSVTLLNDGYPYGKAMGSSQITLVMDAEDATAYQWQVADMKNGTYQDIPDATTDSYTFTPASGKWYRCVVNGTVESKAVQVVKPGEDERIWTKPYYDDGSNYYITNGTIAYMVNGTKFDVAGLYVKGTTGYMLSTSYNRYWQTYSSNTATPDAVIYYNATVASLDTLRVAFSETDAGALSFEADLAEGQQAFSFGCDTQLGNGTTSGSYSDDAALIAKIKNGTLEQVSMMGAASETSVEADTPAFVIAPDSTTPANRFWIGRYSSRETYACNTKTSSDDTTTLIGDQNVVTRVESTDSGMTMSWLNVTSGGSVKFKFAVGSVMDTGAVDANEVSGTVTDSGPTPNPLSGVTVKLMKGSAQIGQTQTTNESGAFSFSNVWPGAYNLVAEKDGVTKTVKIVVEEADLTQNIQMPGGKTSSVVEVGSDTPAVVVGNLEAAFDHPADNTAYTPADADTVTAGGSVEFKMTVEKREGSDVGEDEAKIAGILSSGETVQIYLDISVKKTVKDSGGNVIIDQNVGEMNVLLESIVPLPEGLQGKADYIVYRVHNGTAEKLPVSDGSREGYLVNADKTTITIYAKKFSTYAIGCTETVTPPPAAGGGSGFVHYCTSRCEICGGCKDPDCTQAACSKKCLLLTMNFSDVADGLWYSEAVSYVYHRGLMSGDDSQFYPMGDTSRAMVATILWRLEGCPRVGAALIFNDVAEGQWYTEAVRWAASAEIIEGCNSAFSPMESVTREQLAAMFWRYANYKGYDVSVGEDTNLLSYPDGAQVSSWAASAVQWACGSGVIRSTENGTLAPEAKAARGQVAVMLMRFCENV